MEHGDLDASDVDVKVENGEVTLTGKVDSRWAKRMAEDLAESCMGVRDVMNQIKVKADGAPSDMSGAGRSSAATAQETSMGSSASSGSSTRQASGSTANGRKNTGTPPR